MLILCDPKPPSESHCWSSGVAGSHPESDCQPRPKAKSVLVKVIYIYFLLHSILPSFMVPFYLKIHSFVLPLTNDYLLEHGGDRGYWENSLNLESFLAKNLSQYPSVFFFPLPPRKRESHLRVNSVSVLCPACHGTSI